MCFSPKKQSFRRLYSDNYAVSHQLVSIASLSIFILVVLAAVINSVPISPDTNAISDITDKKTMALQISTILTDSSTVGVKMYPGSSQPRLLSLTKINALNYNNFKMTLGLPSYIDFDIVIDFVKSGIAIDPIVINPSFSSDNLLITRSVYVLIYDDNDDYTWDYEYAILQVKIA